jgi:hypothetical protein
MENSIKISVHQIQASHDHFTLEGLPPKYYNMHSGSKPQHRWTKDEKELTKM